MDRAEERECEVREKEGDENNRVLVGGLFIHHRLTAPGSAPGECARCACQGRADSGQRGVETSRSAGGPNRFPGEVKQIKRKRVNEQARGDIGGRTLEAERLAGIVVGQMEVEVVTRS
ncbi:hypothetical protein DPEC_G00299140 [Dallia pectoralis]|uniref:Uncharacterized protein n=1 Tax=Dallia pectoralis TaxID=75939 RepID=A0ACC2FG26_DALPE|nr:hypothetical protein DPEC_G00299140 [Dallia pectoralis]